MSLSDPLHSEPESSPNPDQPEAPPTAHSAEPKLVRGGAGYTKFSLAALQERIEAQFEEEMAQRSDLLLEARDEASRRRLVSEVGDYVLATESIRLAAAEKETLFKAVYSNLFGFGPLDALFKEDAVIELTIDGCRKAFIRRQAGPAEQVSSPFEDEKHLQDVAERLLTGAGGQFVEAEPFVEAGLVIQGRPVRLTLVSPPLSQMLHLELRLRPRQPATLELLSQTGAINEAELHVLEAIARSGHGLLIVGEASSGKTTLLEAMLPEFPAPETCYLVERAREIRPPASVHSLQAIPATMEQPAVLFAAQIDAALGSAPRTLILDEIRGDEAKVVGQAIAKPDLRLCFVLRSSPEPDRLRSAFSILVRKGQPTLPQESIDRALFDRLPFVVTTRAESSGIRVTAISEWAEDLMPSGDWLRCLMRDGNVTGAVPRHALGLPDSFWTA